MLNARIGNDRYLHFPTGFHQKNEFLVWAVNVSSDGESDTENKTQLENKNLFLPIEYKDNRNLCLNSKSNQTQLKINNLFDNSQSDIKLLDDEILPLCLEDWLTIKAEEAGISLTKSIYFKIFF